MAGYWPSSFLCVFMDRDGVEVHKLAEKEQGQYPAILTEKLSCFQGNSSCGTRRAVPSGQDSSPRSQSLCRIWSILPAHEASHVIKIITSPVYFPRT